MTLNQYAFDCHLSNRLLRRNDDSNQRHIFDLTLNRYFEVRCNEFAEDIRNVHHFHTFMGKIYALLC